MNLFIDHTFGANKINPLRLCSYGHLPDKNRYEMIQAKLVFISQFLKTICAAS